jgi:DNA-binding MarR family transcriptional regulator
MSLTDDTLGTTLANVDKIIHEPARLAVLAILYVTEGADFLYLRRAVGLTKGNLSSHLSRLENAGVIAIEKTFEGKTPRTLCRMTPEGREAFEAYLGKMRDALDLLS